jgi:hypothetical protein
MADARGRYRLEPQSDQKRGCAPSAPRSACAPLVAGGTGRPGVEPEWFVRVPRVLAALPHALTTPPGPLPGSTPGLPVPHILRRRMGTSNRGSNVVLASLGPPPCPPPLEGGREPEDGPACSLTRPQEMISNGPPKARKGISPWPRSSTIWRRLDLRSPSRKPRTLAARRALGRGPRTQASVVAPQPSRASQAASRPLTAGAPEP